VSVMSTVLGSLAPDFAKDTRDRQDVLRAANPPSSIAEGSSHNVALPDGFGPVYNEEAFRYFLQIERKRASRSNSRFLLLLVDLQSHTAGTRFDAATGAKLFAAMWPCLRETDFIGWYRQHRVASAVLTQVGESPDVEVSNLVADRVRESLTQRLPANLAARLQVRVYQVPASTNGWS
jgi:hypothetical protein